MGLGLAIVLVFVGQALYPVGFVSQLDNIVYDTPLALTAPRERQSRIVILELWRRDFMAALVNRLFERVALVGFDVVWAERDTTSGIDVLDRPAQAEL